MLYKQTMKILNAKGKIKERETKRIKEKANYVGSKNQRLKTKLKTKKGKQLYKTTLQFQ